MSKHTKGPWTWDGSVCVNAPKAEGERQTDNLVALIYSCRPDSGIMENLSANARLIAASPDLLAVCREFISALGTDGYHPAVGKPATDRMRAAIAKAEGQP